MTVVNGSRELVAADITIPPCVSVARPLFSCSIGTSSHSPVCLVLSCRILPVAQPDWPGKEINHATASTAYWAGKGGSRYTAYPCFLYPPESCRDWYLPHGRWPALSCIRGVEAGWEVLAIGQADGRCCRACLISSSASVMPLFGKHPDSSSPPLPLITGMLCTASASTPSGSYPASSLGPGQPEGLKSEAPEALSRG